MIHIKTLAFIQLSEAGTKRPYMYAHLCMCLLPQIQTKKYLYNYWWKESLIIKLAGSIVSSLSYETYHQFYFLFFDELIYENVPGKQGKWNLQAPENENFPEGTHPNTASYSCL